MSYTQSMSREVIHAVTLILTIGLAFLYGQSTLSAYDLQVSAVIFIFFFLVRRFIPSSKSRLLESVIFTFIIISIVISTGGVDSPFYFLVYFLLFSLSLLLEPVISITTTIAFIIFFLLTLPQNQDLASLLPIFSLAFLTPFALLLGEEFVRNKRLKEASSLRQKDTLLFLSLLMKNHLKAIREAVTNFMGDRELSRISHHTKEMEKLIERYEKES